MSSKLNWCTYCWIAISAVLFGVLCSCSPNMTIRPSKIRSSEDSIIIGRLRFLPGPSCASLFQLPTFELRNVTDGKSTSFATPQWTRPERGQSIEIPISRKASPGIYEFRIKSIEAPPQSAWLKPNYLTLAGFAVAKGQLVYFGTIEVVIKCEEWNEQSATHYVEHTIQNEFELEINLFKDEFPQVFEMYKDGIVLEIP